MTLALLFVLAKYWTVHIDSVANRAAYEELHKQEYAIQRDVLAAHDVPRAPQWKFSTADGVYFNLRGRASLADFDKPSPTPADVQKEIAAKQEPLEPRIHASLREHHNEIWQTDTDATFLVDGHAPKYLRYRRDVVKPGRDADYGKAQAAMRDALQKRGVSTVAFWSAYGDGAYHYLFLSEQPFTVNTIVPADVMHQWRDCVASPSKEVEAKARYDLTLTDAADWIR
jgi:hypothetical protein